MAQGNSPIPAMLLLLIAGCGSQERLWDKPEVTLESALRASSDELAEAYRRGLLMLDLARLVERGVTVTTPGGTIKRESVEQIRSKLRERQATVEKAIAQRGYASISGRYRAATTSSSEDPSAFWAGLIHEVGPADLEIVQEGFNIILIHELRHEGETLNLRIPGIVVESVLVFEDPMNSDYPYLGEISDGTIKIRPNAKAILAAWPSWVKKPKKSQLTKWVVTLVPQASRPPD